MVCILAITACLESLYTAVCCVLAIHKGVELYTAVCCVLAIRVWLVTVHCYVLCILAMHACLKSLYTAVCCILTMCADVQSPCYTAARCVNR